jgi:thiamine biosynthesis lipoprotein
VTAQCVAITLTVALAAAAAAGCRHEPRQPTLVEAARLSMGSELHLTAWTDDEAGARAAFDAVFAEFDRLEAVMSVWRPDSDIVRLNDAAGQHPVAVSPDVLAVLHDARQISEWTGGKFDVTFGSLSDLWRFDHDQDNKVPDMSEVRRRLPLIDYRLLDLDDVAGTAFLRRPGMRAHLGGIGKGYAIDNGARILRSRGFRDFMIQSGGDLYVGGVKNGHRWRLGIQDPRGPANRSFATIELSDNTLSTSGDYERYFMEGGRRYHHIIDPSTGEPARGCRSVTILSRSAVLADGLSTGVFLLGPEAGLALLKRLPDIDAVIVTAANEVLTTPGLAGRLEVMARPTDAP